MDRLQEIMMAAEGVTFSKNQSSALVGGRRRLERFWRWNAMWQMNILLWKMKRLRWQNVRCYRDC